MRRRCRASTTPTTANSALVGDPGPGLGLYIASLPRISSWAITCRASGTCRVVSNRMRVLRVDAAAETLHDTGSSFPFTSSAAVYFSPDDKLVYAIADQSAQVYVLKFDPDNGKLTPIGTPQPFAVPYALVPAMRNWTECVL